MREVRQKITFRICKSIDNLDKVHVIVNDLLYALSLKKRA